MPGTHQQWRNHGHVTALRTQRLAPPTTWRGLPGTPRTTCSPAAPGGAELSEEAQVEVTAAAQEAGLGTPGKKGRLLLRL